MRNSLVGQCLAEFFGTLILVFFGVGIVNAAVLAGVVQGLWQVAAVWGGAVALAVYATGAVSGAHINPAITVAMAVWRGFPKTRVLPYVAAQVAGAFCGSLILYGLFHGLMEHFELTHHLVRGAPGSELAAMVFGEYFPNPAMFGTTMEAYRQVPLLTAMLAEGIGTAFLASFVFALTEPHNTAAPKLAVPVLIGITLALIISIIAPLTQAGLNPARDFGPRLVSYLLGWGEVAVPGPRGGFFTVYILSPIAGAVFGAGVYQALVRRFLLAPEARTTHVRPAAAASGRAVVGLQEREADQITVEENVLMSESNSDVILVPCASSGHVGCDIVRRAVALVTAATPEAIMRSADECPRSTASFVLAIDASTSCRASATLSSRGVRAGAVVSAPTVLARMGLVKPGVDVRARTEELAGALASAIRESLGEVLTRMRERRRYREEMAPIISRFDGIWGKVEALVSPNGAVSDEEKSRVELLARRSRNLFVKFDEVVPPSEWAEPHDLFQDALLCIAYACEGWISGDVERWEQNLEKARVQLQPLLRRVK
jgi:glycerol uptake facilitator protein